MTIGPDIVTHYAYDAHDNLKQVTDPNSNVTTYAYDDFRRIQTQTSPVTGTTYYTYDQAGNLTLYTDANSATTTRVYDAANRVTSATSSRTGFSTEMVSWTYDDSTTGNYGLGRAATMTDPQGSTNYAYDRRGLLRSAALQPAGGFSGGTYTSGYKYDANANRTTITYPSGRVVNYTFDVADRPISASASAPSAQTYVSAAAPATYYPFGPLHSVTFGTGTITRTVTYDQRYRPAENKLVAGASTRADYVYHEDGAANITQLHDAVNPSYNRDFGYDDLNRLTTANSGAALWGTASGNGYTYDAMGNVLSVALGTTRTATFTYIGSTPMLSSVTETGLGTHSVSYDAAGNELSYVGTRTYSPRNLQDSVTIWLTIRLRNTFLYGYDGRGLRTTLFVLNGNYNQPVDYYFYSPEFSLLSEGYALTNFNSPTITFTTDYIWFNGQPVAQENLGTSPTTRFTFVDHLGTPIIQTDTAGTVTWQVEYEPFGSALIFRTTSGSSVYQPLRFPGQELAPFNEGSTEQTYNIFRWYRAGWGRYTQPDPIRPILPEMPNADYGYASGNPIALTDPLGLYSIDPAFPVSCRPALNKALGIVTAAFAKIPGCNRCSASGPTLGDLFESPNLTIGFVQNSSAGPCAYGDTPWGLDANRQFRSSWNLRITGFACRMGSWMIARAIIHELTHVGGASFEGPAYGSERRCGFPTLDPTQYGCPKRWEMAQCGSSNRLQLQSYFSLVS